MIGIAAVSARPRNALHASKPVMRGMTTSIRIRSGRSATAFSTASAPSLAVTSWYGPFLRIIDSIIRIALESSTTRIFLRTSIRASA